MSAESRHLAPTRLLCESKPNPLGIDITQPRFAWWVQSEAEDAVQSAYQIVVYDEDRSVWDTGKVESDQSIEVVYAGEPLESRKRYTWRVRTWDRNNQPSPWSTPAFFEMALLDEAEWQGEWIGHPPRYTRYSVPPVYLRKQFSLDAEPLRARLYITARGIYEAHLNGENISEDDVFAPGWTDYAIRNQYITYDVTGDLQRGQNALGVILADGWHNGRLKWNGYFKNWYGHDTSLLAQLVIDHPNGETTVISTDDTWKVATGPFIKSDFYDGEFYDARIEFDGWSSPEFNDEDWLSPRIETSPTGKLVAKVIEPVRRQETLKPISLHQAPDGMWIYDFGQNMVGWTKVKMQARETVTATFMYAEMLEEDGSLYTENLRSAKATNHYIFKDDQPVEWEPTFTFHGFRYMGLKGLENVPPIEDVEGIVLNTDAEMTGAFECSNELINRLQSNILWGQKGNYLEVPTDCPQRDERLGWTGDAQVFIRTATFNMNVVPFFEKWMADMRDAQMPDGQVPVYIPRLDHRGSAPAWSDAAVVCPWEIYERYGNERILKENFNLMRRWVDYQETSSDNLIRPEQGFGDWLAVDAPQPWASPTTRSFIGTAYFAHTAAQVSRIAEIIGLPDAAEHYGDLAERVTEAFNREFVTEEGRLTNETQTGYLLALGFDLLPEDKREVALEALIDDIRGRGWHLSTGFVGTGQLMRVLNKMERNDVAYRLIMQETYPGWLYSIKQGATTMWERWNSYTHEDGFGDAGMNSFNHYAYGAVGEWMYSVIGGIDLLEPGFKRILIRPQPGGELTWAKTSLDSPYGTISTDWAIEEGEFRLTTIIPPNTTAQVVLPNGREHNVGSGAHTYTVSMADVALN